jgi:hypothetical protein
MRRSLVAAPLLLAILAAAPPALAQVDAGGRWIVSGRISGVSFTLNCDFQQAGGALTGACIDSGVSDPKIRSGRRHILTRGHVEGDRVTWTYPSSFLLVRFDVDYAGIRTGDHMAGQITVQNRTGAFTAMRAAP